MTGQNATCLHTVAPFAQRCHEASTSLRTKRALIEWKAIILLFSVKKPLHLPFPSVKNEAATCLFCESIIKTVEAPTEVSHISAVKQHVCTRTNSISLFCTPIQTLTFHQTALYTVCKIYKLTFICILHPVLLQDVVVKALEKVCHGFPPSSAKRVSHWLLSISGNWWIYSWNMSHMSYVLLTLCVSCRRNL